MCERTTPEFVQEVREQLYYIYKYNCQLTDKYPWFKKFNLLLIKYVELEYEALYHNHTEDEIVCELRVLRVLCRMLNCGYTANIENAQINRAVLRLLSQVEAKYFVKGRIVWNIVKKLSQSSCEQVQNSFIMETCVTSDYGSDENNSDIGSQTNFIPTINFIEYSDDNYLIYLRKRIISKRNFEQERTKLKKKSDDVCIIISSDSEDEACDGVSKNRKKPKHVPPGTVSFEILDGEDSDDLNYMVYLQKEVTSTKQHKIKKTKKAKVNSNSVENCKGPDTSVDTTASNNQKNDEAKIDYDEEINNEDKRYQEVEEAAGENMKLSCDEERNEHLAAATDSSTLVGLKPVDEGLDNTGGPNSCHNTDDTLQECSLNESLIELLLDENYLPSGEKELKELEDFLFSDNPDMQLGDCNKTDVLSASYPKVKDVSNLPNNKIFNNSKNTKRKSTEDAVKAVKDNMKKCSSGDQDVKENLKSKIIKKRSIRKKRRNKRNR